MISIRPPPPPRRSASPSLWSWSCWWKNPSDCDARSDIPISARAAGSQAPALPPVSACFRGQHEHLAGIDPIRISDQVAVRFVEDGVADAFTVGEMADAPEAVAAGDGHGRGLGDGPG